MNAQYQKKQHINSNIDIIGSLLTNDHEAVSSFKKGADGALSLLAALLTVLSATRVLAIIRVVTVALCLVAFVGLIGAMELGVISLGLGVILGALFLGVELLVLRLCRH